MFNSSVRRFKKVASRRQFSKEETQIGVNLILEGGTAEEAEFFVASLCREDARRVREQNDAQWAGYGIHSHGHS